MDKTLNFSSMLIKFKIDQNKLTASGVHSLLKNELPQLQRLRLGYYCYILGWNKIGNEGL